MDRFPDSLIAFQRMFRARRRLRGVARLGALARGLRMPALRS